jgi:hypothetical protein
VSAPACTCLICQGADPGPDATIVGQVREFGWSVLRVAARVEFAYTIGLRHTLDQPELVMFGLRGEDMQRWLNTCVDRALATGWPADGVEFDGVIDGFTTRLRPVHPGWHTALFGTARRFYQGVDVPVRQLVWPDATGLWPWEERATVASRTRQALAWLAPEDHPPGGWRLVAELEPGFPFAGGPDQYVLTTGALLARDRPVARVVHHDAAFDVLDERDYAADDLCLAFLGDVVRLHPRLRAVADLADGHAARAGDDGSWTTVELTADERRASSAARATASR